MMPNFLKNTLNLLQSTFATWSEDQAPRQAAALAYYGILSLAPMLIIAITIAGIFFGRSDIQQQIIDQVNQSMGQGSAELVENVLNATYESDGGFIATLLSVILLVFASTNIFFQLKETMNQIWGLNDDQEGMSGLIRLVLDRLLAAVMVIVFGLVLLLAQIASAVVPLIIATIADLGVNLSFLLQIVNILVSIDLTTLIIAVVFRYLPDTRLPWKDVWVGALFTSILFFIGQRIISFYLQNSDVASAYGVAGSVIILLVWIYYMTNILLFGAEFTQVYAERHGTHTAPKEHQTGPAETAEPEYEVVP